MFDQRPEPPGPHRRKVALGSSPSPLHNFIQQPTCKCLCARHREHEETADTSVLLQEVQDPQTGSKGPLPRGRGRNTVPFSILAKAGPLAPQTCPIPFRHLCLSSSVLGPSGNETRSLVSDRSEAGQAAEESPHWGRPALGWSQAFPDKPYFLWVTLSFVVTSLALITSLQHNMKFNA